MRNTVAIAVAVIIAFALTAAARPKEDAPSLKDRLSGTTWEWNGPNERIVFKADGYISHPGWEQRGLVTSWEVIDTHIVLLVVRKGRGTDRYAILVFNAAFS